MKLPMVNAINFKTVTVVSSKREKIKIKIKIVNKIIPTNFLNNHSENNPMEIFK